MRERPAAVGGLVDADARHGRAEEVRLAGADPHDVGVRRRDGDVADARRRLVLEDGLPRRAVVVGLPHAARRVRRVDAPRAVLLGDRDVGRAAADVGGAERLPRDAAIRRRLQHRAIGVVGRAQVFGVGLLALLCPRVRQGQRHDERRERKNIARAERFGIMPESVSPPAGSFLLAAARCSRCGDT